MNCSKTPHSQPVIPVPCFFCCYFWVGGLFVCFQWYFERSVFLSKALIQENISEIQDENLEKGRRQYVWVEVETFIFFSHPLAVTENAYAGEE